MLCSVKVPKFRQDGKTVARRKISVLVHPDLAERIEDICKGTGVSLSDFIAAVLAKHLDWAPKEN